MIRAKGHFWLATRPDWAGEFSLAGAIVQTRGMGFWWSAVPKERWPQDHATRGRMQAAWDPVFGDRRQEIVFIGAADTMRVSAIIGMLEECLVGDADAPVFEPEAWGALPDPFPAWGRAAAA